MCFCGGHIKGLILLGESDRDFTRSLNPLSGGGFFFS